MAARQPEIFRKREHSKSSRTTLVALPDISFDRVVVGVHPYGSSDGRRRHHDDRTRLYAAQIANGDEEVRVDWCPQDGPK